MASEKFVAKVLRLEESEIEVEASDYSNAYEVACKIPGVAAVVGVYKGDLRDSDDGLR